MTQADDRLAAQRDPGPSRLAIIVAAIVVVSPIAATVVWALISLARWFQ